MVEVTRETDARRINEILNHAEVRPFVADMGDGDLDISEAVSNPLNVLLMGDFGGVMFFYAMGGVYEAHTAILPEGRGVWGSEFTQACARWMFTNTDAHELATRIPRGHYAARVATEYVGGELLFAREDGCRYRGRDVEVSIYTLPIERWVSRDPLVSNTGREFHDYLNREAVRLGVTALPHEPDENHNAYVGACIEMVYGGQAAKAVNFYNRWAFLCRHARIDLLSFDPPSIRFDIGVLRLIDGQITVSRE